MISKSQNAKYWNLWRAVCVAKGWPQADEYARHSVHQLALGYDKSHIALTNAELDRIFAQFDLLINPEDLGAAMTLTDPDRAKRKRIEWAIRRFPGALVYKLVRDKFDRASTAALSTIELQQLLMTLKRIAAGNNTPRQLVGRDSVEPKPDFANAPY
ncbi:MAG: hypothetical protein ACYDH9_08065 [Limisphaerales bacterium]